MPLPCRGEAGTVSTAIAIRLLFGSARHAHMLEGLRKACGADRKLTQALIRILSRTFEEFLKGNIFWRHSMARQKGSRTGRCQGCNHVERARIERLLAAGASVKGTARKFDIDYHALRRHWINHVSPEA